MYFKNRNVAKERISMHHIKIVEPQTPDFKAKNVKCYDAQQFI